MELKFTMVMDEDVAKKMSFIGKYYGRSRIKAIEWTCKERIAQFEASIGPITKEDLKRLNL